MKKSAPKMPPQFMAQIRAVYEQSILGPIPPKENQPQRPTGSHTTNQG